jgi:hypothetical protein
MYPFVVASIVTSGIYVVHMLFKEKQKPSYYISVFFFMAGIYFLIKSSKAEAYENLPYEEERHAIVSKQLCKFVPNSKFEIKQLKTLFFLQKSLSPEDKIYYQKKLAFHLENGQRCFNDAQNICWWIPSYTDAEKAKICFTTVMSTVTAGTLVSKVVAAISALLLQVGCDCMDSWNELQNKLHWSQYHFEMYEFYDELLKQA